jgi:dTDP-4-amino-4,6-dideoxygalactose transaminase
MMVLDIKEGDAVFCPTFTFFATAETIAFQKATPVFVDSDEATFNICPIDLEKRIRQTIAEGKLNPKAIVAVDLFGLPANYPELERIAEKYNLKLIEDAAQGFGGSITNQQGTKRFAGSFGDIATTSFFPAKPLGCYGDGGAVFTNNDEYAELLKSLRVHGKGSDKYDNVRIGMNSRLDTIQAAILLEKLEVFPEEVNLRNIIAQKYESGLGGALKVPVIPQDYRSSWAQYTLRNTTDRDRLIEKLGSNGVPSMIYYQTCMHNQTAFKGGYGVVESTCPIAEQLSKEVISLPMHPYMIDENIDLVINSALNR